MRLVGKDGASIELAVDGYQFPRTVAAGVGDWDANWLVVSGGVQMSDGRAHSFRDPCLTTWEASELADWLAAIAGDQLPVSDASEDPHLVFTEPCLAFSLKKVAGSAVEVWVHLSLEAEPPFVMCGQSGLFENYVRLDLTRTDIQAADRSWRQELRQYPPR